MPARLSELARQKSSIFIWPQESPRRLRGGHIFEVLMSEEQIMIKDVVVYDFMIKVGVRGIIIMTS